MATTRRIDPAWGPAWPPEEETLAAALIGQPVIAAMLARFPRSAKGSLSDVCDRLVEMHVELVLACLDEYSVRILQLAELDGTLSRDRLIDEAHEVDEAELDALVQRMTVLGLAHLHGGQLRAAPGVSDVLELPLPAFMQSLDGVTSDRLALACRLLGVEAGPRKADRAEAVRQVLRDPERMLAAVTDAGPDALKVFTRITDASVAASDEGAGVPGYGPGSVGQWELGLASALMHRGYGINLSDVRRGAPRSPYEELTARCLVGSDPMGRVTWVWLDVMVALRGSMFSSWRVTPPPVREIDEPIGVASRVLAAAEVLVEQIGMDGPEGKKSGDRQPPVKAVKAAAAVVGVDPGLAVVLIDAAVHLGLLMAVERPRRGRGRSLELPVAWILNEERMAEWRERPPEDRWLGIVSAWLEGNDSYTAAGMRAWARRLGVVSSLASLESGHGIPTGPFSGWVRHRHVICSEKVDDIVADLVRLGVCSSGSVIGLGRAGRAALSAGSTGAGAGSSGADGAIDEGPSAELAACFAGGEETFVVQPDHTIVSAANLAPEVIRVLSLVADQESDGAAVVWRLSAQRLARAARTHGADEIVGFLRARSSVGLSDNVERFVRDHLVAVDVLTISAAGSYIVVSDPGRLTAALAVRTAKLTAVAATVAVSPLEPAKLRDVLATKGVHVETESSTDGAGGAGATARKEIAAPDWQVQQRPVDQPLARAEGLHVGPDIAADLARRLADG